MTISRKTETAARGGPQRRAAPAGGALNRGRGCHLILILPLIAILATPLSRAHAGTDPLTTPSGLEVMLQEFVDESEGQPSLLRARFVAPTMTATHPGPDTVLADMEHLCNAVAIPHLADTGTTAEQIVVSVSAQALELGVFDPDIPQYFEAYTVKDGTCMWEWY